jgi:hypothetical protein
VWRELGVRLVDDELEGVVAHAPDSRLAVDGAPAHLSHPANTLHSGHATGSGDICRLEKVLLQPGLLVVPGHIMIAKPLQRFATLQRNHTYRVYDFC